MSKKSSKEDRVLSPEERNAILRIIQSKKQVFDLLDSIHRELQTQSNLKEIVDIVKYRIGKSFKNSGNIKCSIFQSKNEILGVNYAKQPTTMSLYSLSKHFSSSFAPFKTIQLEFSGLITQPKFSGFNSNNSLPNASLQQIHQVLTQGTKNNFK